MVFNIARGADEICKGVFVGLALQPRRLFAILNFLNGFQQCLPHGDNDNIGRAQIFLRAILNGALRFNRKGILRGEVNTHAAKARARLHLFAILHIAIFGTANMAMILCHILMMVLNEALFIERLSASS